MIVCCRYRLCQILFVCLRYRLCQILFVFIIVCIRFCLFVYDIVCVRFCLFVFIIVCVIWFACLFSMFSYVSNFVCLLLIGVCFRSLMCQISSLFVLIVVYFPALSVSIFSFVYLCVSVVISFLFLNFLSLHLLSFLLPLLSLSHPQTTKPKRETVQYKISQPQDRERKREKKRKMEWKKKIKRRSGRRRRRGSVSE